jgi:hypothetical protein
VGGKYLNGALPAVSLKTGAFHIVLHAARQEQLAFRVLDHRLETAQ